MISIKSRDVYQSIEQLTTRKLVAYVDIEVRSQILFNYRNFVPGGVIRDPLLHPVIPSDSISASSVVSIGENQRTIFALG